MPRLIQSLWWICPYSKLVGGLINQKLLEEFLDENESCLLLGIPSREPFLVTQYLGKTLCEFRSAHEELDVTSWMSSCDDAMLHATARCWSLLVTWTSRRTCVVEKLRWGNSEKNQPLTWLKDLCADGLLRRCDQSRVKMFKTQRVSSQTVGFGELLWKPCTGSLGENGWILRCKIRCWTRIVQNWLQRFWRRFVNSSMKVINCIHLKRLQDQYQKSLLCMIKSWRK